LDADNDDLHFKSEPLGSKHNRAAFSCGDDHLDAYLKTQANQERKKKLCAVFVLTPDEKTIAGFYTLSQYSVEIGQIPEDIGRFARSVDYRGKRVGEKLLLDALRRCLDISREVGSWAVIVDAKDETSAAFYREFGFVDFPNIAKRLFLTTETIEDMFA
jgi:predicted GNAT family N-acyltransferase